MKQILQNLKTGEIYQPDLPTPRLKPGHLLIQTSKSLVSLGTERMLVEFGEANWFKKALQQPDKVRQVIQKIKTDGIQPTLKTVIHKLDKPMPLGYCNAGTVIGTGKGVLCFDVGDRVASNGPHAEVVCVPENLCAKIPDKVPDEAAAFTVVCAIALQGVRLARPTLGETFVVQGLGLIGLLTVQILMANGCQVIGFDLDPQKVTLAREYGAKAYGISERMSPVDLTIQATHGVGADGVIICAATKSNDPIHQAPQMCRKRGRVILIGVVGLHLSRADFYEKEILFQVSCSYGPGRYDAKYEDKGLDYPVGYVRWTEQRNFEAILQLMATSKVQIDNLITEVVPLNQALQLYANLGERGGIGYLIDYPQKIQLEKKVVELRAETIAVSQRPVIGFIGAGDFASRTLIPAFQKAGVKLKCIASASGTSGYHQGKKFGFEVTTTEYLSVLNDPEINAVVVVTRHDSHANFVLDTLKAGKHVFVEKPLCINEDELDKIETFYHKSSVVTSIDVPLLMVGFNRRFSPLIKKTKELLGGQENTPKAMIMTVNAGSVPEDHWIQDPNTGGGRIVGEVCHFIDVLRFLTDQEIVESQMITMDSPTEDTVAISLTFADGSIGTVHYFANGHKNFPKERLHVFCAGKILIMDNFRQLKGFGWGKFKRQRLLSQDKGYHAEVRAFLDAIEKRKPIPIPFEEIVEVTRTTLRLVKSNYECTQSN